LREADRVSLADHVVYVSPLIERDELKSGQHRPRERVTKVGITEVGVVPETGQAGVIHRARSLYIIHIDQSPRKEQLNVIMEEYSPGADNVTAELRSTGLVFQPFLFTDPPAQKTLVVIHNIISVELFHLRAHLFLNSHLKI